MTPEERYAATFRAWVRDDQKRHDEHFTSAIREAESSARAKAFEEAEKLCDELRKAAHAHIDAAAGVGTSSLHFVSGEAHAAKLLADKIRGLAKEQPRAE